MVISIKKISNEELEKIKGGTSVTVWAGIIYSTIIIFIAGIIEGFTNPSRCGETSG